MGQKQAVMVDDLSHAGMKIGIGVWQLPSVRRIADFIVSSWILQFLKARLLGTCSLVRMIYFALQKFASSVE